MAKKKGLTKEQHKARTKQLNYARARGIFQKVDSSALVAHTLHLRQHLTLTEIAHRSGVSRSTLSDHITGRCSRIDRDSIRRVLAVRLEPDDYMTSEQRGLGARRIITGLAALGWSHRVIAEYAPNCQRAVTCLASEGGYRTISQATYEGYLALAEKLERLDPRDHGVAPNVYIHNKARARMHPPLGAWDLDTIHLPESQPEWTGECGTAPGYYLHLKYNIAVKESEGGTRRYVQCQRCCDARRAQDISNKEARSRIDLDEVAAMREKGWKTTRIAAELGVTSRTITRLEAA